MNKLVSTSLLTSREVLLGYFRKNGAVCPVNANPAEWMLDAIGGSRNWGAIWRESLELANDKEEMFQIKTDRMQSVHSQKVVEEKEYATPLWHQIKVVNKRAHLAFWRSPNYCFTRFFNHVSIALITSLAYSNLDDSLSSLQ